METTTDSHMENRLFTLSAEVELNTPSSEEVTEATVDYNSLHTENSEVDYDDITADFSKEPMTESLDKPSIFMGRNKSGSVFYFFKNEANSPLAVTITLLTPTLYRDSEPLNKPALCWA